MPNDNMIRVQEHPNLARDRLNNALIDVDEVAYERYMASKRARYEQETRITQLEETINKVESDISDIKSLLNRLLEK